MQAGTCADPIPLNLAGAVPVDGGVELTFTVDTSTFSNNQSGSCNSTAGGPEAVYQLTLTQASDVTITAGRPAGNTSTDAVLFVRNSPCASGTELGCSDQAAASATERVNLTNAPAGNYFVFVEHYDVPAGASPTEVIVRVGAPTLPPVNDQCPGTAVSLTSGLLDGGVGESATVSVNTLGATNQYAGACAAGTFGDVVYSFTLAQPSSVRVAASAAPGSSADPIIYLQSGTCGTGPEVGCSNTTAVTQVISNPNLAAGTYFVVVESFSQPGPITLTIETGAPIVFAQGENCTNPMPLVFDGGVAFVTGDTSTALNDNAASDVAPTCTSTAKTDGRDLVYSYTLTAASDVNINLAPTSPPAPTTFAPALYVRDQCAGTLAVNQLACVATVTSVPQITTLTNQQPGTYFIWADSTVSTSGPFSLTVSLAPPTTPPANDLCVNAQVIPSAGGTVTGSTNIAAVSDVSSCGSSAGDVAYSLTLTSAADVAVTMTPTVGTFRGSVQIRSGCGGSTDLACNLASTAGGAASASATNLQPGTYIIWVDGAAGSVGSFSLNVQVTAPSLPPSNDLCTSPALLFPDGGSAGLVNGTFAFANDNYSGSCTLNGGRDVVYAFSTTGGQRFTAQATVGGTAFDGGLFRPTLFVRHADGCLADAGMASSSVVAAAPGCFNTVGYGENGRLEISDLDAGSYLLVVDSFRNSTSITSPSPTFQLEASLGAQLAVPANDSCAAPQVLTLTGGSAVAFGTTRNSQNDHVGLTCSSAGSGTGSSDVVYSFTTPAQGGPDGGVFARVNIASLNGQEYTPAVFLRSSCQTDAGIQVACSSADTTSYAQATVYAQALLPSTEYFVWVDSSSTTATRSGPFRVQVDVNGTSANDTCAGAVPLTANVSVPGTTLGAAPDYSSSNIYTGGSCTSSLSGPEVVYTYTSTTAGPVTVAVQPQRGFDVGLAVMSACTATSCIATADPNNNGDQEVITFTATANTTYFIFVDSFSTAAGGNSPNPRSVGGFIVSVTQ